MKPLLTIAIPTFNRPEKLLKQVEVVSKQLRDSVVLLVVDNSSSHDPCELLADISSKAKPGAIRIHRNVANVGLAGNICRCLEIADGEWVWLLGDDDLARPDAVDLILAAVSEWVADESEGSPCIGGHFSTGIHQYPEARTITKSEDYWHSLADEARFSNALFLSSCVFHSEQARKNLRTAFMQIYSAAPHIAVYAVGVIAGGCVRLENRFIVDVGKAESGATWNRLAVLAGITSLVDIPGAKGEILEHLGTGIGCVLWRPYFKTAAVQMMEDCVRPAAYWRIVFVRLAFVLRGKRWFISVLLALLTTLVQWMPFLRGLLLPLLRGRDESIGNANIGLDRI
jgi:glycosyltransferase involved in cell wall biosynthesis